MYNIKNISETFLFDKYYITLRDAKDNAKTDNILPGRYILIKYTDEYFNSDEKTKIKASKGLNLTTSEKIWYDNWQKDIALELAAEIETDHDFDRLICQKIYEDGKYIYLPLYKDSIEQELTWGEF